MTRYCEQVVDGPYNRGNIVETKGPNLQIDCFGYEVSDAFHSIYMFGEEMNRHIKDTGGIRAFNGPVYAEALVWDMDNSDLDKAKDDTTQLIERLTGEGIENSEIEIFTSGGKGFHVYVRSRKLRMLGLNYKIPQVVKYTCMNIAEGLESADRSIYDRTRIIRISNSKHPKTGNYKTLLTMEEFTTLSMDEIVELGKVQRPAVQGTGETSAELVDSLIDIAMNNDEITSERKLGRSDMIDGIYSGFSDGGRNEGLTSLAGMLNSRNFSPEFIHGLVTSVNQMGVDPLDESEVNTIVDSVSKYTPDEEFIDPDDGDILTMENAADKWVTLKQKREYISTGYPFMDEQLVNFDPGKVFMIAARGGIGKTLLSMNIANNMALSQDGYALFISLEMSASAIYNRAASITYNRSGKYTDAKSFTEILLNDGSVRKKTVSEWERLLMVDKDSLGLDQIEKYYNKANDMYEDKVKVLLIDYVGLMGGTDDYKGLSMVAKGIKALAKRLNVRIVLLVQLSRKGGDGYTVPGLSMLRDSGSLEESGDIVLGMWRSSADELRIHNIFMKNRDGERGAKFDLIQQGLIYEEREFDDTDEKDETSANGKW